MHGPRNASRHDKNGYTRGMCDDKTGLLEDPCSFCLMSSMLVTPALRAADKTVLIGYAGPLTGASARPV